VDVGLPHVLCLGVDMGLVIVFQGWVIVLVGMSGRHVLPLAAVPEVVHHVSVLVGVNDRVMGMLHGLPPGQMWEPARGARPGLAGAALASLGPGSLGRLLMLGLVPDMDSRNPWRLFMSSMTARGWCRLG
jgi:hypothetical protein